MTSYALTNMHDSAVGGSYVNEGTLKVTTRVSDPVRVLHYITSS